MFDSSKIPGEIIDLMVVNTTTLKDNPKLAKALVGAWYETLKLMAAKDPKALAHMAKASGTDLAGFNSQLATTKMFWTPAEAHTFATSPTRDQDDGSRCASSRSIMACSVKARRPSTRSASSSPAARRWAMPRA